ncbi:16S rRNA (cytosine(967)-C(5))-methyltransferase [Flavonifractor sp. An92]|uniref:16S rRNA (cytosine(967)-C(5))-methyltransferase RsmB n=1 Tax=Flavonifractor sp. An92 TaxID=1965666 RepID=UPI000B39CA33|nr:16S rRNA (cytosine(967)-C(5))-methyltransferase RsmB [Flavonifractor sp. An92]OUN07930.1 16S rRNA (cytosine(967)-C(5))-methyltransferase [Flavonifractor sp. An92]
MGKQQTARSVALDALLACENQGAWSDGYLKKAIREAGLDSRDAGLCTRLCCGVLQNEMLLDALLDRFAKPPVARMEPAVCGCLRLGLYQILFLDRVPDSAAVNESVSLARGRCRNPRAAGLVNAILRNLLRERESLAMPEDLPTRYSHPAWLVEEFSKALGGEGVEELLAADNGEVPTAAQVNTLRITPQALLERLESEGVEAQPHPWLEGCLLLSGTGNLEALPSFQEGLFYIQDPAARLAVLASGVRAGDRVLDACAAPGGKSFAAAIQMAGEGSITSCDIHPKKVELIRSGAARLGISTLEAMVQDGKQCKVEWLNSFDAVLTDVPCSGLGIIRKKPDIRYKDPELLLGLPRIQSEILNNCAQYVRPQGTLLYATCTVLERENSAVVADFLDKQKDFTLEPFTLPGPIGTVESGMLTLWPHIHGTDGFFFAKLRRRDDGDL